MQSISDIIAGAKSDEYVIELLKKFNNSKISKIYNISDKNQLIKKINPQAEYKYAYALLDTNNASPELSTNTSFGWHVLNTMTENQGSINLPADVRDIVSMRVFPITMQLNTPVGEITKTYVNSVANINNAFTILIHEFAAQSYIGRDGRKFHFALFPALLNATTQSNGPAYTPPNPYFEFTTSGKANGWFYFNKKIVEFSTMTVSIGNPFDLVSIANNTRILIPIQLVYV